MTLFGVLVLLAVAAATSPPISPPPPHPPVSSTSMSSSSSSSSSYSSSSSSLSSSSSFSSSSASSSSSSGSKCPTRCRPTCKVPNPSNCDCNPPCVYCGTGKVWDEEAKKCVEIYKCRRNQGCNGDPNASIRESPPPCPSTCESPDQPPCKKMSLAYGCACNNDYILNEPDGICIKPDLCPGGNPCGVNGTFTFCKLECSAKFCPVNDGPRYDCLPFQVSCSSGCQCKNRQYLWASVEDRRCILAQECPEIPCTRKNEEWDACPPPCFDDSCFAFNNQPVICAELFDPYCRPGCRCKKEFGREYKNFTCIPGSECPPPPSPPPPGK